MFRASAVSVIRPLLEERLLFCLGLKGGYTDESGRHWTWQSAEDLRGWLIDFHRIEVSNDTVRRALEMIVAAGRWVRHQFGKTRRSYYYTLELPEMPCAESIPQPCGDHSALERNPAAIPSGRSSTDPSSDEISEPSPEPEASFEHVNGDLKLKPRAADDGMFPNSQQPAPITAPTTPTATPETPVAQPEMVGEDQGSAAAAEPVENPKVGLLAQIRHISGDLFRYMNKTYALAELLQRPSLRASGITEDDLDPLIGF